MIIKRNKVFSKMSEDTKDNISTAVGAGLGAGSGYLVTKKINPDNLQKLANKIEWKTIKNKISKGAKVGDKATVIHLDNYDISRGPVAEKIAKAVKSEKLAKLSKNPAVKIAVIGGAALGVGAGVRKSIKNKKK